jgi:hypothetical protein
MNETTTIDLRKTSTAELIREDAATSECLEVAPGEGAIDNPRIKALLRWRNAVRAELERRRDSAAK